LHPLIGLSSLLELQVLLIFGENLMYGYEVQNNPIVDQVFEEFDFEMRVNPVFIIDGVIVDLKANQTLTASNECHIIRCARAANTDGGILLTMTTKGPVMKIVYTDRNLPTANLSV
jgi:hypothetical protein